jgi:chromate transporter
MGLREITRAWWGRGRGLPSSVDPEETFAALGVFRPWYLFVVIRTANFRRSANDSRVKAFVDGVIAATTGAIAGAALVLGRRSLLDTPTIAIGLATLRRLTAA